ncbi:MAG: NFACT family protein [Lachnospiraceae bacterium]|nr:NFACT family protein [Lachnospiraceae bacterium]
MAFDGFVVSNLVHSFKQCLVGGRITKISQPEKDEIILTIKNYDTYKLDISVSASLPLVYLTEQTKPAPLTAPGFCMLLRKHLNSARILDIIQPEMERVIQFKIEHLDEMGDLKIKWLIVELMGKHSNIIFADDSMRIIDSIKHISQFVSSVREVLPGRDYFIPKTTDKTDAHGISYEDFYSKVNSGSKEIYKAIYSSFTGFSPLIANEICHRAGINPSDNTEALSDNDFSALYEVTSLFSDYTSKGNFQPVIITKNNEPVEFSCFELKMYDNEEFSTTEYESISQVISSFYSMKEKVSRINQKSATLRKCVSTAIERVSKKYDLQLNQLKSTEKRDKYKVYGELITTYGYSVEEGSKSMTCINYYDGQEITIPLDDSIPVIANAKKYFDRYSKLKRTYETVSELIEQTADELYHLKSIQNSLDIALHESDLAEIRKELADYGYIKKVSAGKGKKERKEKNNSKPLHYRTPDGFDLYVGKNNYQNDELTFKFANGGDWWFHAKNAPGSHVIVKSGDRELPDKVYEQAASLAAYYSSLRDNGKVEIDYLQRKNVKKPNGSKPGFVVYYTNYSLIAEPDISELTLIEE